MYGQFGLCLVLKPDRDDLYFTNTDDSLACLIALPVSSRHGEAELTTQRPLADVKNAYRGHDSTVGRGEHLLFLPVGGARNLSAVGEVPRNLECAECEGGHRLLNRPSGCGQWVDVLARDQSAGGSTTNWFGFLARFSFGPFGLLPVGKRCGQPILTSPIRGPESAVPLGQFLAEWTNVP